MVASNLNQLSLWRVRWFRALFVLDLVGLLLATYVASRTVPIPKGQMLVILSATLGLTYWFALQPRITLPPYNRYLKALACPPLAAFTTLAIQASLRDYYSGTYLAKFTIFWLVVMIAVRVVMLILQPPPRILLIGESQFWRELASVPRIRASRLHRPPSRVGDWDMVVLDPNVRYDAQWLSWLAHADMRGVPIVSAPLVLESLTGKIAVEVLDGSWATEVFRGRSDYIVVKRVLDLAAVIVLFPFLLLSTALIAILVLIDSGRPVWFWQERTGLDGKPFKIVKFRTMRTDAEHQGVAFAKEKDHRITRFGAFLRRFRLDEVPQFWNVLLGQMSVIGPRPEQTHFVREFQRTIPLYELRHTVKPGITGWAQVVHGYAGNAEETHEKLRYDFFYVKHLSFWLDAKIVLLTLRTLITGFGSR